jgi:hypothetical protein
MRILLFLVLMLSFIVIKAQNTTTLSPALATGNSFSTAKIPYQDSLSSQKWFFTTSAGFYTGITFNKYGAADLFATPLSIQLNRRLNNNLYAFANVSAAPAFINLTSVLYSQGLNKLYSFNPSMPNRFGIISSASVGLMYVNDAKTFSISGSIGTYRTLGPGLPYITNAGRSPVVPINNR